MKSLLRTAVVLSAFALPLVSLGADASIPVFSSCPQITYELRPGNNDTAVKGQVTQLQQFLYTFYGLDASGISAGSFVNGTYGKDTQSYVARFQREHGLFQSGIASTQTVTSMKDACLSGQQPLKKRYEAYVSGKLLYGIDKISKADAVIDCSHVTQTNQTSPVQCFWGGYQIFDQKGTGTVAAPISVTVLSPNGGEEWKVDQPQTITWQTNSNKNVRIELWKNGKFFVNLQTSVPAQDGKFTWTPQANTGADSGFTIRISVIDATGGTAATASAIAYDDSDRIFNVAYSYGNLMCQYTLPSNVAAGATLTQTGGSPDVLSCAKYCKDSGETRNVAAGGICWFGGKAISTDPQLTIVSPAGGNVIVSKPLTISWKSNLTGSNSMRIELWQNAKLVSILANDLQANTQSFVWTPPVSLVGTNYVIRIIGLRGNTTSATPPAPLITVDSGSFNIINAPLLVQIKSGVSAMTASILSSFKSAVCK